MCPATVSLSNNPLEVKEDEAAFFEFLKSDSFTVDGLKAQLRGHSQSIDLRGRSGVNSPSSIITLLCDSMPYMYGQRSSVSTSMCP